MDLQQSRRRLDRFKVQYQMAKESYKQERVALKKARTREEDGLQAQQIAQQIAQGIQQRVHQQVARVVTKCLAAVFDEPYQFKIDFQRKRGRTEARLVFIRDGVELTDPMNEVGGGVIDVASLALRLACLLLGRPVRRRVLLLDEPFKNIRGEQYRRRTRTLLLRLAEEMGVQWVINTDIDSYRLGTVVELP